MCNADNEVSTIFDNSSTDSTYYESLPLISDSTETICLDFIYCVIL